VAQTKQGTFYCYINRKNTLYTKVDSSAGLPPRFYTSKTFRTFEAAAADWHEKLNLLDEGVLSYNDTNEERDEKLKKLRSEQIQYDRENKSREFQSRNYCLIISCF
jgi:hypothetical protein